MNTQHEADESRSWHGFNERRQLGTRPGSCLERNELGLGKLVMKSSMR